MATPKEIKQTSERVTQLVNKLLKPQAMVRGSFSTVYRRCGKPTCWCAEPGQKGHASTRITWTENGISHTKTLKEQEHRHFQKAAEAYRTYRRYRRQLRSEEKLLEEQLDLYESDAAKAPQ